MKQKHIRNFCIIAHIDHGKSTLADRLMETTKLVSERDMKAQLLDDMDLEREKGITIKARAVRMLYKHSDGETYQLNMIDTPGHVDFAYEVSRSLSSCDGALLVVDATQGIEAQTVANVYLATEQDLTLIPVINKVDLQSSNTERVKKELEEILAIPKEEAILASAKSGIGIEDILTSIVERIPAPEGDPSAPLKALIFDSVYDTYRGIIIFVRIFEGTLEKNLPFLMMGQRREYTALEVGIFTPTYCPKDKLSTGDVGYIVANIKEVSDVRIGDTITLSKKPAEVALPGYKEAKPMVYCGLYPVSSADYSLLREALDKLKLNDASIFYEPETSSAIGFGFRCGFLGLLHMEIIQERIEREFDLNVITTTPNVPYLACLNSQEEILVNSPSEMPEPHEMDHVSEPYVKAMIIVPSEYIGGIMTLIKDRRGIYESTEYLDEKRVILKYELPLAEVVNDFYDKLKSVTRGYASFDYEFMDYRPGPLVKLRILVNGESVDPLSIIVSNDKATEKGRKLIEKLKELIPRQLFEIVIQAAIGGKIVAKTQIRAIRKNVTAKCYGGDISRKRKLLEKQKEGKKRMKQVANIDIPQDAFLAVLKLD
ncbi:elongation factor 4 [PVC group bacterium (ex Bugula neritina AB1)]|nr:elongation factor 4 [PVC group bacterium (ex Bugula neritina AB1)]